MVMLLKNALKLLEEKNPDTGEYLPIKSLGYCTYSRQRDEGGDLIEYKNVTLTSNILDDETPKAKKKVNPHARELNQVPTKKVNPLHRKNETRCIRHPDGSITKINFRLITSINNQPVVY